MILLDNVSHCWEDGKISLKGINLEVNEGEFILISGKSGSGKSTLGSTINGLIPHYYNGRMQGKVYVNGKDLSEIKLHEIGQIVGTVFQDPRSQFFTTTTDEEIAFVNFYFSTKLRCTLLLNCEDRAAQFVEETNRRITVDTNQIRCRPCWGTCNKVF